MNEEIPTLDLAARTVYVYDVVVNIPATKLVALKINVCFHRFVEQCATILRSSRLWCAWRCCKRHP